jgi:glucosamine-6-phosphate deaminase
MKLIIHPNETVLAETVAGEIAELIHKKKNAVLGLPTGSTAKPVYKALVQLLRTRKTKLSQLQSFNVDEFVGLADEDPGSFHTYMNAELFHQVSIDAENTQFPDGVQDYDKLIDDQGGMDLLLLGIGVNGHIGFNEPGTSFYSPTHKAELSQSTRQRNASSFENDLGRVPTHGHTMGIGTMLRAKRIILIAFGEDKADIIRHMIIGEPNEALPATALHLHRDVECHVDIAAASRIR